jgi:hypothetical protein
MNIAYASKSSSSYVAQSLATRTVVSGFDPMLNAYFLNLIENNQEASLPLLFPFEGEDDSISAQHQQQKLNQYKNYWVNDGKSVDEIIQQHALDIAR